MLKSRDRTSEVSVMGMEEWSQVDVIFCMAIDNERIIDSII